MSAYYKHHDMRKIKQITGCFNNQVRLLRNTNISKWWDKQAEINLKRVVNVALALPVTQGSVERTFSGLRYILNGLRLGL